MCRAAAGASGRSLDVRVASDEDGESRGRRGAAIMGRTGSRPTGSFFVIDYLGPSSSLSLLNATPLIPLPWVFVIVPRFVSPFRHSTLLSAGTTSGRPRFPPPVSSRLFSLLRAPVSQTLAKPRRRQRLSCRSTRPHYFHRDGSFFTPLSSSYRTSLRSSHFLLRFLITTFSSMTRKF